MNQILEETEKIMQEKYKEFIGHATGDLRVLLERIWFENFSEEKTSIYVVQKRYNKYISELEKRGFSISGGEKCGISILCISWE